MEKKKNVFCFFYCFVKSLLKTAFFLLLLYLLQSNTYPIAPYSECMFLNPKKLNVNEIYFIIVISISSQ